MAKYRATKIVTWECDKVKCVHRNTREIEIGFVIYEDVCDYCHKSIHEPLTIDLAIRDHKKGNKNT